MIARAGFAFFLLFVFTSAFSIALSQLTLAIATVLTIVAAVRERFNPFGGNLRRFWISVAAYVGWLVLICLFQERPLYSLDHIREEWLFVVIPVGVYYLRDRTRLDWAITALAGGVILVGTVGLGLHLAGFEYHWGSGLTEVNDRGTAFHGFFAHTLTFGNYMAVAGLALLGYARLIERGQRWTEILALVGGLLALAGLIAAGSRGPILAGGLGLIVLTVRPGGRIGWFGLGAIAAIAVAVMLSPNLKERFTSDLAAEADIEDARSRVYIWNQSLGIIDDHLVVGVGPGNFGEAYRSRLDTEVPSHRHYTHAHNDLLQTAARSGLVGLAFFVWLWWQVVARLIGAGRARPEATLALVASLVFLAASMTEATFADEEVRAMLMLVWAIGLAAVYKSDTGGESEPAQPIT